MRAAMRQDIGFVSPEFSRCADVAVAIDDHFVSSFFSCISAEIKIKKSSQRKQFAGALRAVRLFSRPARRSHGRAAG
jgi:hypothetical protein